MAAKHRTSRALVAVFASSILVATACTSGSPTATGAPTAAASATEAPQKGGRIIEGTFSDIRTLQPMLVADTPSGRITSLLYDTMISADPQNGEPKPNMATFTAGAGGKTYTFEVKASANWSDGKPVIAEDWATGVKAVALSKITVRKNLFENIVGFKDFVAGTATTISGIQIDSANPKKWTVTLDKVQCDGIFDLNGYTIPAHVFGKYVTAGSADAIDKAPENDNPTVFSGAFKFKEWRKGDQVILTRNDTYWKGAAHVDEFVYKVVASATVVAAQLKTGELNFGTIEPKDLADMERVDNVKINKYQNLGYTYIGWRVNSPTATALADKRVRQALAYGLNMDDVIKAVLFGEGTKQVAHHVPVQWAYPAPASLNSYAYDPAKAEDLIKQAGYTKGADGMYAKDGKTISFTIRTNAGNTSRETLAQVASEQYKKIGVDAKTQFEAFQGLVTQLQEGHQSIEAVIIGWALGTAVDPYGIWHSSNTPDPATKKTGFNFTFFKSAALDKAIEEGRSPANGDCSIAARKQHYETFNKILNDEQPYNFGFATNTLAVTAKNLENFKPGPFSTTYNINEWWFKK
jgi:peptide/nickel transport system substrate-binding protein